MRFIYENGIYYIILERHEYNIMYTRLFKIFHMLLGTWPPRSPDLTPCDYTFGDILKTLPLKTYHFTITINHKDDKISAESKSIDMLEQML